MQYSTDQTKLAELFRDGWSLATIARRMGTTQLRIMFDLGKMREEAGCTTNDELRGILKGFKN